MVLDGEARLAAAAILLMGVAGCGGKTASSGGGLDVVVTTDLALPKDLDRLTLDVTQGSKTLLHDDEQLGAGHLLMPAQFHVAPSADTAPVLVRGVAYKDGVAAIERSAITPIPTSRAGVIRLAMNYLCVGSANADGTSTCGAQMTCNLGACQTAVTKPETQIPTHPADASADAADGSTASAAGGCFDVAACFAAATAATIDLASCSVAIPAQADAARLNIALELPASGSGVCTPAACFVVLDSGADGWTVSGSLVLLPKAICQPNGGAAIPTVVVTTSCAAKSAATPACGSWSGPTTPTEMPPPPIGEACQGAADRACGNCGTQSRTCRNGTWSDWGACAAEGPCVPNAMQACGSGGTQSCGGSCQWGACTMQTCTGAASQACGNCGTQTRTCDGNTGIWSAWGACTGEGACAPDATQACGSGGMRSCGGSCQWGACTMQTCTGAASQACGNCGTQTRTCDGNAGIWSAWGACTGEGACAANATRACGMNGTQTCGGTCQWATACTGQTCSGPASQACGNCGTQTRTCDSNTATWSAWGACTGQGACAPNATRSCGMNGTQTCGGTCQWATACTGQMCSGPASQACGNCGTQTRTCDSNTGAWSAWGACTGEGACAANATRACGMNGTQTCGGTCQWATACTGQTCQGAASQACGNCGTQTRTCDSNTGAWSAWAACSGEGVCMAGASQACGTNMSQTCSALCAWGTCGCGAGLTSCSGACVNTASDNNNCGACGTKCQFGKTCSASACVCPAGAVCGTVLATSGYPYRLAVDSGTVYWTDYSAGTVTRVPAAGGATMTIYPGPGIATDLAVAAGYVFWSNGGSLLQVPTGGGTATTLAPAEVTDVSLVQADASNAYYMTNYNIVRKVPIGGGTIATISPGPYNSNIIDMALFGDHLYWTNNGIWNSDYKTKMAGTAGIYDTAITATAGSKYISNLNYPLYQIAVDASYVYWVGSSSLNRVRRDVLGDTVTSLGQGFGATEQAFVSDGTNLYWVTSTGHLYSMSINGGTVSDLATGDAATSIAQDASYVYWISGTSIVRRAK